MSVWGWLVFLIYAPFVIRWAWRLGIWHGLEKYRREAERDRTS